MKCKTLFKYLFSFFCIAFMFNGNLLYAQKKEFVLVLDAGHGGRDPGAVGKISKEKDINLAVVKLVGELVSSRMSDVKVIYTRKKDVFIPLEERASIANNNHADMFISIHVNAAKSSSAHGAETYTLGLAKTQSNLDVAMAENSVMLLEDDYKTKYRGFDPSSVDSYIMFEFMMDTYLDNSIAFATDIQQQFTRAAKRFDRGVRQAGFWVLHRSACPSVLIELGFISNYSEEMFLTSNSGQRELSESIYNAFAKYKKNHDKKLIYATDTASIKLSQPAVGSEIEKIETSENNTEEKKALPVDLHETPVFKIQIMASPTPINTKHSSFKGLKDVDYFKEGGMYKYTYGYETAYSKITKLKKEINTKFHDAFVVAFVGEKKISVTEALNYKK